MTLKEENINNTNFANSLWVLLGAIIFTFLGLFIASDGSTTNLATKKITIQVFLFFLFIIVISFRTYYFSNNDDQGEFFSKFIFFSLLLLPCHIIFWTSNMLQPIAYIIAFLSVLAFCLVFETGSGSYASNPLLIFLTTTWTLLSSLIIFKETKIAPLELLDKFSFLQLDKLGKIRLIVGALFLAALLAISISHGLKKQSILKPRQWKKWVSPSPKPNSPDLLKLLYFIPQVVVDIFINPIVIGFVVNILIFGIIRIIIDFLLRVSFHFFREFWTVIQKIHFVLLFLILHILSIAAPYLIDALANPLISYISGQTGDFKELLNPLLLLASCIVLLKFLVIILFTEQRITGGQNKKWVHEKWKVESDESRSILTGDLFLLYPALKASLFPTTYSLLVMGMLAWFAGLLLMLIHQVFGTGVFITWGVFTKYFTFLFVLTLIMLLVLYFIRKNKSETQDEEDDYYFRFSDLNWDPVAERFWWFLVLIGLVVSAYLLIG